MEKQEFVVDIVQKACSSSDFLPMLKYLESVCAFQATDIASILKIDIKYLHKALMDNRNTIAGVLNTKILGVGRHGVLTQTAQLYRPGPQGDNYTLQAQRIAERVFDLFADDTNKLQEINHAVNAIDGTDEKESFLRTVSIGN